MPALAQSNLFSKPHKRFEQLWEQFKNDPNSISKVPGVRMLGSGYYGKVFTCPWDSTLVIKTRTKLPFKDGWLNYAAYAMKHYPDNPLLPKIYRLRVSERGYIVLMERLDKTVSDLLYYGSPHHSLSNKKRTKIFSRLQAVGDVMEQTAFLPWDEEFIPDPYYLEYAAAWYKNVPRVGHYDFHSGNIMVSLSTGRVVITDPFGESKNQPMLEELEATLKKLGLYHA